MYQINVTEATKQRDAEQKEFDKGNLWEWFLICAGSMFSVIGFIRVCVWIADLF